MLNEAGDMTTGFLKIKVLMFLETKFDHSTKTESEGGHRQDFAMINYSDTILYNAKVLKELEMLNEAGEMTTGFVKINVRMFGNTKFEVDLDVSAKIESKSEQRHYYNSGLVYSDTVGYNDKMLKELEMLNEAGDMTTGIFKIKVQDELEHSTKTARLQ